VTLAHRPRRLVASAAAALSALTVVGANPGTQAGADSAYTTNCPRAESLVPNATWHRHTLAKGVVLSEAQVKDSRGVVSMHVLRIDLSLHTVGLRPLVHALAQRTPLTHLAANHPRLIAATNSVYYDFDTGAPLGPVVYKSRPLTASATKRRVFGIGSNGRAYIGHLWLAGSVTVGTSTRPLAGMNLLTMPTGVSLVTPRWGTHSVRVPWGAAVRYVTSGKVSSGTGRWTASPTSGSLMLVARGRTAVDWLSSLRKGTAVTAHLAVKADTPVALTQAYQVGTAVVQQPGVVRTGMHCRRNYPLPARTAVGTARAGRTLMLVVVTDHPGTSMHGLDANQMSKLMVELGAGHASLLDGSGSSEMLARVPGTSGLTLRNYPADGAERTQPVGVGIFRR